MKKRILSVLALSLVFAFPVFAQDVSTTPEPTAPPVVVVTPAPTQSPEQSVLLNIITVAGSMLAGVVLGGGSVLAILPRLKNDAALITAINGLYRSAPVNVQTDVKTAVAILDDLAGIGDKITADPPVTT